jgi:hypothetical protein
VDLGKEKATRSGWLNGIVCFSTAHRFVSHRRVIPNTAGYGNPAFNSQRRTLLKGSVRRKSGVKGSKTMSNIKIFTTNVCRSAWLFLAILGLSAAAVALPQPPPLACGDLIQTSIKLTRDLGPCPGDGIRIAAATPLTLDLTATELSGRVQGMEFLYLANPWSSKVLAAL